MIMRHQRVKEMSVNIDLEQRKSWNDWLFVVLRIYVTLAIFRRYRDLGAGDNHSLGAKHSIIFATSFGPEVVSLTAS